MEPKPLSKERRERLQIIANMLSHDNPWGEEMEEVLAAEQYWREELKKVLPSEDQGACIFCGGLWGVHHDWHHESDCPWVMAQ